MDKLFRIPPVRRTAKNGSGRVIVVEHRVGREAIFFTQEMLLRKTGLESEYSVRYRSLDRRITNKRELEDVAKSMWKSYKITLRNMIHAARKHWNNVYEPQGAMVRATYVPVDEKGTLGFYIQGIVDAKTRELLVGDPEDVALWSEVTAIRERSHVNSWEDAMASAKALLKLPSINKDLQARMKLVLTGDVPMSVSGLIGQTEAK